MTNDPRGGRGAKAFQRKARSLRKKQLPCALCGGPIDYTLPPNHPGAYTADHITPLAAGGKITGPIQPAHRSCNSRKNNTVTGMNIRPPAP